MASSAVSKFVRNVKLTKFVLAVINLPQRAVEPEVNPAQPLGYFYPIASDYFGPQAREVLEQLAEEGLLERELVSKELGCPKDGSINITVKRHCPRCNATNISKQELVEHVSCGYIGPEKSFQDNVCPKCKKKLEKIGVDYIKHGQQYVCAQCGHFFQEPVVKAVCHRDKNVFLFSEAREVNLYAYKVTKLLQDEITKALDQQRYIREKISELGFTVHSPAKIKGRSGIEQSFFLLAQSGRGFLKINVVVELVGNTEIGANDILTLYAKALDVNAYGVLVGALPKMSEEAKKVAASYNIAYVEGDNLITVSEKLVRKFAELVETPEERILEILKPPRAA